MDGNRAMSLDQLVSVTVLLPRNGWPSHFPAAVPSPETGVGVAFASFIILGSVGRGKSAK